jgi:2-oxoglutarate ferredoxin oxidoreductase subunit beta
MEHPLENFLRKERIPHIWCTGCGNGIVLNAYLLAIKELNYDLDKIVTISGIGCAGRASGYVNTDALHTTHGRAIPFAIGIKLSKPELRIGIISGDGDLIAIGGNHFVHGARRNIDLCVICINNFNYGMTGGQLGPTTPEGAYTSTSRDGNLEPPFNLVKFAISAGAIYVARWTILHFVRLKEAIMEAFEKKGFGFVEVLSNCPTYYARLNKLGEPVNIMKYYKENTVIKHFQIEETDLIPGNKIVVGKFIDIEKEEFSAKMHRFMRGD